jgi:hypothetical protein
MQDLLWKEWCAILGSVREILYSIEECSTCRRITECESLPSVEGYFCEGCLDELALASKGCSFSLMRRGPR